jgi:hypothetical protein
MILPSSREPAHAAELPPLSEILFPLRRDLNSVVVMVGGDQQALGVELDGMRLLGTPQARAGCADDPQGLAAVESSLRGDGL